MSFNPGFKLPNIKSPELFPAAVWRVRLYLRTTIARLTNDEPLKRLNRRLGRRAGFAFPGRRYRGRN